MAKKPNRMKNQKHHPQRKRMKKKKKRENQKRVKLENPRQTQLYQMWIKILLNQIKMLPSTTIQFLIKCKMFFYMVLVYIRSFPNLKLVISPSSNPNEDDPQRPQKEISHFSILNWKHPFDWTILPPSQGSFTWCLVWLQTMDKYFPFWPIAFNPFNCNLL